MIGCAADYQKKSVFVQVRGDGFLQNYSNNSPMVVYVPEGFQVRFRIWTAGRELGHAQEQ